MDGHAAGQRAGWVLAATVLAFGASSGVSVQPHGLPPSPLSGISSALADSPATADAPDVAGLPAGDGSPAIDPSSAAQAVAAAASTSSGWPRIAMDPSSPAPARPAAATRVAPPASPKPPARPAAPRPAPKAPQPVWWSVYHGTNHVWMPILGINQPVYGFACSRSTDPANYVYRWGCAGTNNVYLLGHAWGVFKALHDAYYNGRLRDRMPVIYADSHGHVQLYRVTWWRVSSPTWVSWSAQRVPSMTLQTCLGALSQYRLDVRLVAVSS